MLKKLTFVVVGTALLAACGSIGRGPSAPVPTPSPKLVPAQSQPYSQEDAEAACLVQGARKFGVPLAEIRITEAAVVDAGYRVRMDAAGQPRICIIAKDGFVRSLR